MGFIIDGLGDQDKRQVINEYLQDYEQVHVYAVTPTLPAETINGTEFEDKELFEGYDTLVISEKPLTPDEIARVVEQDRDYIKACEKARKQRMEDASEKEAAS